MLRDLGESVRAWLAQLVPPGTAVSVSAGYPWAGSDLAALHAYLHEVAQEGDGTSAHWATVRDPQNHPLGRTGPSRRYRVVFLITAWCDDPMTELALLGAVLSGCAWQDTVPKECLRGRLVDLGEPILARCAPEGSTPNLRRPNPVRTALPLLLLVPMVGEPVADVAPPPRRVQVGSDFHRPGRNAIQEL